MDDNSFDDGYEPRTPTYRDTEADREDMVRTFESIPESKHQADEETAKKYASLDFVQKATTEGKGALLVEDAKDQRRIDEASAHEKAVKTAAEAGAPASGLTSTADAFGAPGGASDAASGGGGAGGDGSASSSNLPKPDSLESTLAGIKQNGNRQRRLIISGDPAIEKAFFDKLEAAGKLHYSGGTPVITLSRREALKELAAVAAKFEGASATHALSMKMQREGMGLIGSITAGLKNNLPLGRSHRMDVVVVGDSAMREAKLKEVATFVEGMKKEGHIGANNATVRDGQLVLNGGNPVSLRANASMQEVLSAAKIKVAAINTAKSAEQQEYKSHKHEKDMASMAKDREKDGGGAEAGAGKDAVLPVNKFSERLASSISAGFAAPDNLHSKNKDKQVEAVGILHQLPGLKDPVTPEFATLPAKERQQAIVELAALVSKVDNKEFMKSAPQLREQLDERKRDDAGTIREKVDALITMEGKRDPAFAEKAEPILKSMVERKILSEAMASAISAKVAEAAGATKQAGATSAATQDAQKAPDAGKDAVTTSATADASASKDSASAKASPLETSATETRASPAAKDAATPATESKATANATSTDVAATKTAGLDTAGAEPRAAADTKDAATPAAESKSLASDSTAALAAKSTSLAEGVKAVRVEPTLGEPVTAEKASAAAPKASSEAPAPVTDKPLALRDRIESIAKDGPANLTSEKAHDLVAALDAIRTKPLTSLDAGKGTDPTRTLVRTEALLKELESGRFGAELKSQAKDLAEPLQKWAKQDTARFNNDASVTTLSRDDVVAGVKTGLVNWDGAAQAAQKDAPAAAPAPSKEQDSAAPSTPANPEKAPASSAQVVTPDAAPTAPRTAAGDASPAPAPAPEKDAGPAPAVAPAKDAPAAAAQATGATSVPAGKEAAAAPAPAPANAAKDAAPEATVVAAQAPVATAGKDGASAPVQDNAAVAAPAVKDASAAPAAAPSAPELPVAKEAAPAPVVDTAAAAAKEQAALRLTETESAGGKLSMLMANPAGSFTNRDKTWNVENVQRAATEVLRIDPESVSQMSGSMRTKLASYSAWVAENARDGKLPGFDSAEGKAQVSQLVDRAAALIGQMDEGSKLSPDVQKSVTKADNLVNSMEQLQKTASTMNQAAREVAPRGGISQSAASSLATDLVHAVYRAPELSDAQAKYLLKNAANLTPESTKGMEPQKLAQTAVAMSHISQQVRDGAMGDFSKLPPQVQKNVVATSNAAESLLTSMGKDPALRGELSQAYTDLHAKNSGAAKTAGAGAPKVDGLEQSAGGAPSTSGAGKAADAGLTKSADTGAVKADAGSTKAAAPVATKPESRSLDR